LSVKVTPFGNVPLSLSVGVGTPPMVVTGNVPYELYVNVALLALVKVGATPILTVGSAPASGKALV
jgi:hypothetical protein